MKIEIREKRQWVTIVPGEYYVTKDKLVIATLLGSCVAACLWDAVSGVCGMNHFLLSNPGYKANGASGTTYGGRYGIHSMELLINKMISLGAKRKFLNAKVFGGGNVLTFNQNYEKQYGVGTANVKFIGEFLESEKIPLVSSALGGEVGRIIRFHTDDYAVYVKEIKKMDITTIKNREKLFLEKIKREFGNEYEYE